MKVLGIAILVAALAVAAVPVHAQVSDGVIKIGVLNDQSSLYADLAGQGSVVAPTRRA
jgi:branched-chain amino acid transport system substrate-binding protein